LFNAGNLMNASPGVIQNSGCMPVQDIHDRVWRIDFLTKYKYIRKVKFPIFIFK
jgi:hypothetical protein